MKITYDPQNDRLHILFRNVPIEYSRTEKAGMVFDYDDAGRVVGLEIQEASHQMYDPRSVEFREREANPPVGALTSRKAAVDHQYGAGEEARVIRGQK